MLIKRVYLISIFYGDYDGKRILIRSKDAAKNGDDHQKKENSFNDQQ